MSEPRSPLFQELKTLQEFFLQANALLQEGKLVDLTGIDARIAHLCQDVQAADPVTQQQSLPELMQLIGLLNAYGADMKVLQDKFDRSQATDKPDHES